MSQPMASQPLSQPDLSQVTCFPCLCFNISLNLVECKASESNLKFALMGDELNASREVSSLLVVEVQNVPSQH